MHRFLGTIAALLAFASPAYGGTTYDLKDILSKLEKYQAGVRYQTTVQSTHRTAYSPHQAGTSLEEVEKVDTEVIEADVVTEIQQVDAEGRPTSKLVTYNQFDWNSLNGSHQAVQGLQIQIQKIADTERFEYQRIAGPTIPSTLKDELEAEIEHLSRTDNPDADRIQQLLPNEPVAVGKSWSIDVIPFLESMDAPITPSTKRSKGRGSIEQLDHIDGRDFLTLHFEIRAKIDHINDMPCKSSCVLEMELDLQVPVDGVPGHSMMANSVQLTGRFGSPHTDDPNMVDMDLERTDIESHTPALPPQ